MSDLRGKIKEPKLCNDIGKNETLHEIDAAFSLACADQVVHAQFHVGWRVLQQAARVILQKLPAQPYRERHIRFPRQPFGFSVGR